MYLFVNGAQVATGASTYNFTIGNAYWGAGAGGSNNSVCYISNLRVLKGTGLYSSSFTPSTQPLNVVTNTVLLSAQSNRFVDNSANNFTLTYNGSGTTVQAFSPFVPAYITPTTYSNWFDGSGDYLSLASNAAFNIFNGDMTIECWFNQTSTTNASQHLFAFVQDATNRESIYFNGTTLTFWTSSGAGSGPRITYSAPTLNAWHHLAIVKSGSTFTMYVDGISAGTSTTTQYSTASQSLKIATYDGTVAADYFTGVISNVRIVKGTAVYTANFTPPTAPLTAITNTQLLTCQSSTFIDNSTNAFTVTPTGNVQPVTSPTPFNPNVDQTTLNSAYSTTLIGGSYYGAATGDYLSFTDSSNLLDMGTTAASFECWYYMTATGAYQNIFLKYGGTAGWNATNGIEYGFAINNGVPTLSYFTGGTSLASISDPTTRTVNQWYHFAIATDASNNISMYVNGVRVANATSAISKPTTRTTVNIGSTSGQYVVGYLAGMRFLTGANAYNAASLNIGVPPLTPPTAVSGTQLLCNFTNGGIFDDTAKNVLQTVGDAQISTTQSKWGGSSLKFDGTGDWLVMRSTAGDYLQLGGTSRPFTIEAWTYPTSFATNVTIAERGGGNANWTSTTGIQYTWFFKNSDSKMYWQYYAGGTSVNSISSSVTISLNTWTHVAVSYDGTTTYLFVNGVQVGTGTSAYTIPSAPTQMRIGAETDGSNPFFGYIDDLRVTQGVARYVTNFTPPTSALQNQ
jgi:hypothetical protein